MTTRSLTRLLLVHLRTVGCGMLKWNGRATRGRRDAPPDHGLDAHATRKGGTPVPHRPKPRKRLRLLLASALLSSAAAAPINTDILLLRSRHRHAWD